MPLYILRGTTRQAVSSDASCTTHCDLQQNPLPSLYGQDKNDSPLLAFSYDRCKALRAAGCLSLVENMDNFRMLSSLVSWGYLFILTILRI